LADREKLFQVFLNIIENSFESAKENGLLTIESKTELKNLILRFTDDGNGIPYDLHEKIFEPFYTTKSSGTGLGLAVVQKIIEQHRGRITLKASDLGKTIFEIHLPLE
jgi:signal transduction histidine kinase